MDTDAGEVAVVALSRRRAILGAVAAAALLSGCASMQEPDVRDVASRFADATGDPAARCDLLLPSVREALESDESAACPDVIGGLPLSGGAVQAVQVWGGNAQVRLDGDTVFLTETGAGWRVFAAGCQSRGEAPYDCEVEGP